jgi:hypothetical protein
MLVAAELAQVFDMKAQLDVPDLLDLHQSKNGAFMVAVLK